MRIITYLTIIGAVVPVIQAQALDFSFSITDDFGRGTVTGEIFGLQNNATSDPSDILITSLPSAFSLSTPYSLSSNGWLADEIGGFTVTNGVITSDNFTAGSPPAANSAVIQLNSMTTNAFYYPQNYIGNERGLTGQDLAAVESPESPTIWLILAAGFILAVYLKYFFNRKSCRTDRSRYPGDNP